VTERNYDQILEEVNQRSVDMTFDSATPKPKFSQDMQDLNEIQAKAVDNYRRRIYDAWSVLRAANIIAETDSKHFRYNKHVLESAICQESNNGKRMVQVDADKLEKIEDFISRFDSSKNKERREAKEEN